MIKFVEIKKGNIVKNDEKVYDIEVENIDLGVDEVQDTNIEVIAAKSALLAAKELNQPVIDDIQLWSEIMDLTPLKRWATPEEIADWAYFLTVINKFCTAQNILVDGGEAANFKFVWKDN